VSKRVVAALSAVSVLFAVLLGQAATGASTLPKLTSVGSSFAGVAISEWAGQFDELDGGNVNFTEQSSIIGLNQFCNRNVDFAASDISYAAGQAACSPKQVPYPFQYIPDVGGSLAFEYNLKASNGVRITDLVLNAPTLLGIFTGSIKNWNNPAIQALNPGIPLPNKPITAYYRSDPSGENYLLSDYFAYVDPGPLVAFQKVAGVPTPPGSPSATWASFPNGVPPQFDSLVAADGADAASQGPLHTNGGIAYVETAYAKNVGLPVASVVNAAGAAVQPTADSTAAALQGAIFNAHLIENLGDVFTNTTANAYPLSEYSYFVAQCVPKQAAAQNFSCAGGGKVTMGNAEGAELAQFITYVACLGQSNMAKLGYTPLPPVLVEIDFQAAGRLPGGTTPPPPTAKNCQNPYFTGKRPPPGARPNG
jgi:phosphate transport system substrate-binding protein